MKQREKTIPPAFKGRLTDAVLRLVHLILNQAKASGRCSQNKRKT